MLANSPISALSLLLFEQFLCTEFCQFLLNLISFLCCARKSSFLVSHSCKQFFLVYQSPLMLSLDVFLQVGALIKGMATDLAVERPQLVVDHSKVACVTSYSCKASITVCAVFFHILGFILHLPHIESGSV